MLQRIRQFYAALFARLSANDKEYVARHLTSAEVALFYAMDVVDQRHALDVAYLCEQLAVEEGIASHRMPLLRKAALLHDSGKQKGDLSILSRSLAVVLVGALPNWTKRISHADSRQKLSGSRQMLHVYYHHPAIGAAKAGHLSLEPLLIWLIEQHHATHPTGRPQEEDAFKLLAILQQADRLS